MNKCFLLNPEKNFAQIRLVVFDKNAKNASLIPKNDVTEPKDKRLGYSNNQSKNCKQLKHQFQASENHAFQKPETDF